MSDKAFCQIGKYMSDFLVNFLQRFLQLPQLSGTDSRFHLSVLHRFLHLLWLLSTDSRFLVFVLHSSENSRRTNQRKGTSIPNHTVYSEKPGGTYLRNGAAVPNCPEYSANPGEKWRKGSADHRSQPISSRRLCRSSLSVLLPEYRIFS